MKLLFHALIKFIAGLILVGVLLFLPAGTWGYGNGWLFTALLFIPMLILGVILFCKAPGLLERRLNTKEKERTQRGVVAVSGLVFVCAFVLAGLDFRFGWSDVPSWLVAAASVVMLVSYGLYAEVMRENAYLSRTVEVQENQKVVDSGLYGIVRHPMYMATVFLYLAIPLVLGSWVAFAVMLVYPALIIRRIKNEELVLEQGLSGYKEYVKKVRYRLLPFVYLFLIMVLPQGTGELFPGAVLTVQAKEASNTASTVKTKKDVVIEGKEKWLFYALDNSIEDYQGTVKMSQAQMDRYLLGMEELHQICQVQGKEVCFLIPPNKEQVYGEFMPDAYPVKDTYKRLPRLVDYIQNNSDVNVVYPLNDMLAANMYCRTYLKTDSHWTSCGAFVGMQAVYAELGMPVTPLYLCAHSEVPTLGGDLIVIGKRNVEDYDEEFDYVINYKPEIECVSPQESNFNEMLYWSVSSSENPQKIVVIGDSFCMRMTPFLMKDFSECLVVHRNYMDDPFVAEAIKAADVIVVEAVERYSNRLLDSADAVKEILLSAETDKPSEETAVDAENLEQLQETVGDAKNWEQPQETVGDAENLEQLQKTVEDAKNSE